MTPSQDRPSSTGPFASRYPSEAAEVLSAIDAGTASLEDVDRSLTDGVAHSLELEAQLRRLQRQPSTQSIRERIEAIGRRRKEIEAVVVRLRGHRNAIARRVGSAGLGL